jgi:hypothetical protein
MDVSRVNLSFFAEKVAPFMRTLSFSIYIHLEAGGCPQD